MRNSSRSGSWSSRSRQRRPPHLSWSSASALSNRNARPLPPICGEIRQQIAAASAGISGLTTRLERLENSAQSQTAGIAELKTGLEQLGTTQQAQTASLSDMTSRLNRTEQAQQAQAASLSDLTPHLDRIQKAEQAQAADVAATLGPVQQDLAGATISRRPSCGTVCRLRKVRAVAGWRPDRHGTDAGTAADPQRGRSRAAVSGGIRRFVVAREGGGPISPPPPRRSPPFPDGESPTAPRWRTNCARWRRRSTPASDRPASEVAGPERHSTGCAAWSESAASRSPSRGRRPSRRSRSPSGRWPAAICRAPWRRSRSCRDRPSRAAADGCARPASGSRSKRRCGGSRRC